MNKQGIKTGNFFKKKSSAIVSMLVLVIAIGTINAWQLVLPNFSYDNSFSIAAAKNIYDGKGYTLTNILPQDLSATGYESLNKWPPGYSFLLVFIKKITGADWIISCYILNAIGATLLILALRKIMLLLNMPARIANVYLLFAASVPYPFLSYWFSDLQAAAFFMWALALLLLMIVKNKYVFACSIASALLLGWCAWLKYLYLPVSLVPFIVLIIYALKSDKRPLLKPLVCGSIFLLLSLVCLLWFQQAHSGAAFYINPTGRGFFPESLLHLAPIIPGSIVDFKLMDFQLSTIFHIPYQKMIFFWRGLNILLLPGMIFLVVRFYKEYSITSTRPVFIYLNLSLAISVTVSILLLFLSLTQAPYTSRFTKYWTYLEELRYFALVLIFIPQIILLLIFYRNNLFARSRKPPQVLVTIIVVIQITHGIYYLSKQILWKKEVGKNRVSEQLDLLALKTANDLLVPNDRLVVSSNSNEIANIASLAGIPVMYKYDNRDVQTGSSKPVTLLLILSEQVLPDYKDFFLTYHPKLLLTYKHPIGESSDTDFYVVKFPGK